jgi:hypothetical protein
VVKLGENIAVNARKDMESVTSKMNSKNPKFE